jgi:hypothetical protein
MIGIIIKRYAFFSYTCEGRRGGWSTLDLQPAVRTGSGFSAGMFRLETAKPTAAP